MKESTWDCINEKQNKEREVRALYSKNMFDLLDDDRDKLDDETKKLLELFFIEDRKAKQKLEESEINQRIIEAIDKKNKEIKTLEKKAIQDERDEINILYGKAIEIAKTYDYLMDENVDEKNLRERIQMIQIIAQALWCNNDEEIPDKSTCPSDIVDFYERSLPFVHLS